MDIEKHVRDTLIAYREAHLAWKNTPDYVLIDTSDPSKGTVKAAAKRVRGKAHSKVLELAELLATKPP